jgi:formamidopyrimidine-DNA glycosylase
MPELPEVEYTARQLRASIVGATIQSAHVFWPRIIGHPDYHDFLAQIADSCVEGIRRRGKYLLVDLSGGLLLTVHRRMSGNFLLLSPGWQLDTTLCTSDPVAWDVKGPAFSHPDYAAASGPSSRRNLQYCRVCFVLADGRCLLYTDPRKFGRVALWTTADEGEALHGLGPEPLAEEFSVQILADALAARKSAIKQALLDQAVVAGVGNIYADEALFYAGIHPKRQANSLSSHEVHALHEGIVSTLSLGIEHGGTSFNDYSDLWGAAGDNYNHVRVYQRDGQPCIRCGSTIERVVIAQRSSHYCPACQKLTAE